jgi:acyl carrier protein
MSREEIRQAILDVLAGVAPEGEYDRLKADRPLRDQLDIDSYDFLNVILALHERLGVDIPEAEYQKLLTLNGAVDYLAAKVRAT